MQLVLGPFLAPHLLGQFPLQPNYTSPVERLKPVYTTCGVISLVIQLKLLSCPLFSQEPNTMQLTLPNNVRSSKKPKYSTPKKKKRKSNIHIHYISLIPTHHARHLQWGSLVTVNPGRPPVSSVQTGLLEYMYS